MCLTRRQSSSVLSLFVSSLFETQSYVTVNSNKVGLCSVGDDDDIHDDIQEVPPLPFHVPQVTTTCHPHQQPLRRGGRRRALENGDQREKGVERELGRKGGLIGKI